MIDHRLDSYGLVLLLILLDYLAVSTLLTSDWGKVVVVALLGATLLFALRTSKARRIWRLLALGFLVSSVALTLASVVAPATREIGQQISIICGVLLIVTPLAIARRISTHRIVTTETVLGALCIYLLIGFSFAFIYLAIGALSPPPFFTGQPQAPVNAYLFFSYTTLTTVGYGDLVPEGSLGQTFAMVEALMGQIYLVIVVARLVSLWGQERIPSRAPWKESNASRDGAEQGGSPKTPHEMDTPDDIR
jgi:hypothetical protein